MKANRILLLLFMLVSAIAVDAQVTLQIPDLDMQYDEIKEVSIEMNNEVAIRALQVRVVLPKGITLVSAPQLVQERVGSGVDEFGDNVTAQKSLKYNIWADGSYMITVNSDDGLPFADNKGAVIKFSVKADYFVRGTTQKIELKDIELVNVDGDTNYRPSDGSSLISISCNTITYKVDGEVYLVLNVAYGATITPIAAPTKEGHTFSGWSEIPATMPVNDVVVEGTFSVNSYTLTYKVDGAVYKTETVAYGATIEPIVAPTKEGHTFSGWSEIPETMPANDVVVEGSFSINNYNITYKVDGKIYATDSIKYGATITPITEPTKEGHTFSGWSDIPATMPAKDVVIEGNFTVNSYLLTYKMDGKIYATDSIKSGATIEQIEAPTKEGHTFSGWSDIPTTMPANDVVIEGTFSINSYTLTYKVDGEIYATDSIKYGATIELIEAPTKEGHTFSGWSEIPATMPANDVVIEGSFSINSYTVTYKVDGEVYKTETIEYGATIEPIEAPTKEGHTFSGWSEIPTTMPAKDIVVEGTFSINSYTVTFMVDGEVYETMSVAYGATNTPIAAPTKEGHTFSGWSDIPATMPAEDIIIEGSYSINSYTITYKVDGEVYETMTVKYGATIEPIVEPTKEGHTFSGWSEIPETMPANDIVVEGSFSINSYTVIFMVDGEVYETMSVAYGATITPIAEPTKEGHTFSGWSEIPATMPANDVIIEGTFSFNSYTVTFMVDGEVYETMTVKYGAEIELPTPPEKEGYIFTGWIGVPATMPAEDIVIEGRFEVDTTGINAVILDLEKNEVYNLKGQRITESENLTRGIYIVNGKKVYIK